MRANRIASQEKRTTRIGDAVVPIRNIECAKIIRFTEGYYAFWTAVYKKPVKTKGGFKATIIPGRALVGFSAGDRFDRMNYERKAKYIPKAHRPIYNDTWTKHLKEGRNVAYVRPSTNAEIWTWLSQHPKDAETLQW